MKDLLTPKQVAKAIGVSESSMKRWCDQGRIPTERTAGGHRRVTRAAAIKFIRETGHRIVEPDLLGLPCCTGQTDWTVERAGKYFRGALVAGREDVCRQLVVDLYLGQHSVASICDRIVAQAIQDLEERLEQGELEVYEERRGCEICVHVIHELRELIGPASRMAPTALAGILDGAANSLPAGMAEVVLRSIGWNATSLGHGLPFQTIRCAVERHQPRMLWLGVPIIRDESRFCQEMNALCQLCLKQGTAFVINGKSLASAIRKQICFSSHCETYEHLATIAETLQQGGASAEESSS